MTEQELDLERKRLEDLRRIQSLRLLDDDFMNKVFEDKACAEFLLHRPDRTESSQPAQPKKFTRPFRAPGYSGNR